MPTPNIIYILADDMGYGDTRCNDPACRIPTPNLDRLASRGMRFTDAHAGSSLCTPSRYSILTGRYAWRSRLKRGIVWDWDAPLIEPDRTTVASFLKSAGYDTACFGKWHLGWDWPTRDGTHPNETLPFGMRDKDIARQRYLFGQQRIDYAGRITGGPVDRGFDHYFGVDVPNFPPYAWFEDDHLTEMPTAEKPADMYGHDGKAVPGWSLEAMIPEFTSRAVNYIERHAAGNTGDANPFFIYFPLTSPHSPIVPNEQFHGLSGIGSYGDFVCEVDWVVGQVMDALQRTGQADNTLLIFTSDNGPENRVPDDEGAYERARRTEHFSMGPLRGIKRDAWEGGHRTPFLAAWPGNIPANTTCHQTVGLHDFIATVADIINTPLPHAAGEDSVSIWPLLKGNTDTPTRDHIIHHSGAGKFAIRQGEWVYIEAPTGGDNPEPDWFKAHRGYQPHNHPAELYNLKEDLAERTNRYADQPDIAQRLSAELQQIKTPDAITPAPNPREHLTE